jgi:hypothetical protein
MQKEIKEYNFNEVKSEPEKYEKIKEKVKEDLSVNTLEQMMKYMNDMNQKMNKFDEYVDEKRKHRQEKSSKQMLRELPNVVTENMLKEELKKKEMELFSKRVFGR